MTIDQMDISKTLDEAAEYLAQNSDYQVLRRFVPVQQYHHDTQEEKLIGVYLDIETTGLDYQNDKIIELALVAFEYSQDGKIFKILGSYCSFQDPGAPLNEQITVLTGITDNMVKDQAIDHNKVEAIIQPASLIIAHNASFDRKFIEKILPIFKQKAWGCSCTQVPWKQENISSVKLEYLAYKFGFFYDAHRAEVDCLVGIHLLTQILPISNELAFKALLNNVEEKSYIIWATNSPFNTKDILKARGYRWNDGNNNKPKAWYIEVSALDREEELNFLYQNIYSSKVNLTIDEINQFNRFAIR